MNSKKKVLTRSKHGLITGTLRGFADYYDLNLTKLQFVFVISALFGIGFVIYFVLWISIPSYSQRELLLADLEKRNE